MIQCDGRKSLLLSIRPAPLPSAPSLPLRARGRRLSLRSPRHILCPSRAGDSSRACVHEDRSHREDGEEAARSRGVNCSPPTSYSPQGLSEGVVRYVHCRGLVGGVALLLGGPCGELVRVQEALEAPIAGLEVGGVHVKGAGGQAHHSVVIRLGEEATRVIYDSMLLLKIIRRGGHAEIA